MKRDYKLYLSDIKESIEQIEIYLYGISEEYFKKNQIDSGWSNKKIRNYWEASRNVPRALKEKNKHVPWFQMSQFRDFIAFLF